VPHDSSIIFVVLAIFGIAVINLDDFYVANQFFNLAHKKISKNYRISNNLYGLIVAPAILAYQLNDN
jgi:hypothetical protein